MAYNDYSIYRFVKDECTCMKKEIGKVQDLRLSIPWQEHACVSSTWATSHEWPGDVM